MPAVTRMSGWKNMTATWPMSSSSKARLPKKLPISFRPSCRQRKRVQSAIAPRLTWLPMIFTFAQKNCSTTLTPLAGEENYFKAVQLLDQAVVRDPAFLVAHCQLAYVHDLIYLYNYDHTETRLALAETSVRAAVRLQPDSGETHLAQAIHFYWGYLDYDRAREELAKAQHALPNNAQIFWFLGLIDRRQGRWDETIQNLEHAVDLDPRDVSTIGDLGQTYYDLRKYGEALAIYNRELALEPQSINFRTAPASIAVDAE